MFIAAVLVQSRCGTADVGGKATPKASRTGLFSVQPSRGLLEAGWYWHAHVFVCDSLYFMRGESLDKPPSVG